MLFFHPETQLWKLLLDLLPMIDEGGGNGELIMLETPWLIWSLVLAAVIAGIALDLPWRDDAGVEFARAKRRYVLSLTGRIVAIIPLSYMMYAWQANVKLPFVWLFFIKTQFIVDLVSILPAVTAFIIAAFAFNVALPEGRIDLRGMVVTSLAGGLLATALAPMLILTLASSRSPMFSFAVSSGGSLFEILVQAVACMIGLYVPVRLTQRWHGKPEVSLP